MVDLHSERARIRGLLVNSGRYSFEEADSSLVTSEIAIEVSSDAAATRAGQAALLTAVVTAARCFGVVRVCGALELPSFFRLPGSPTTLGHAVTRLGGIADSRSARRSVMIGPRGRGSTGWGVQAFWNGWLAGVTPASRPEPCGRGDCVLAGVVAGAEVVAQAFLAEQGDARAGTARSILSLWAPESKSCEQERIGPSSYNLPHALWLIGVGNLGQSFVWSLSLLADRESRALSVYLQDDDVVTRENWGTSVLVQKGQYGDLKTRIAEDWLLASKVDVRRIDRRLDEHLRRTPSEPSVALAGLHSYRDRRLLGKPGFAYVIDAGLGSTHESYQRVRINTFDAALDPETHFAGLSDQGSNQVRRLLALPAYQALAEDATDHGCGAALLAEAAVAVPFVSAIAGAFALAQAVRVSSGYAPYRAIIGDVGQLGTFRATPSVSTDRAASARPTA